jgi:subtilisin-like proprotein convertase family protein
VQDPAKPVKVTLAWTDVPGPTSGSPVVNDLDLVVDAGGRTYKGNVFATAFSRTGGSADPRNNLESVYLPSGTTGPVGVTVRGTAVVGNGVPGVGDATDQDFALVVSNADELAPSPVLSGELPALSDAGPGGDDDGALEPAESFTFDQGIRNGGDGAATGVSATVSGGAPLTLSQPTSAYPDTGSGASSTNATRFAGAIAAGATCGADVTATLSVATDQGSQDIPIVLPTGYPGSASPQSRTHSPALAIPDDSSAGVSSTIVIPELIPGQSQLIKDIDVNISRITHGWVGDLTIQLTGPDGTTVRLAQHPGGPDNGGKNFVDTVFDDEAALNISSGTAPYTGSFRPQSDELSRFDGKPKEGTWTLRVRDLFEGDTGTLIGWGTNTRSAVCARNPQTTITSGPPAGQFVEDTSADFTFTATESPGTPPFQCRLDAQEFGPCEAAGSQSYPNLSQGPHTFEVRAIDAQGDADPSPASHSWTVDTIGPSVDIDPPSDPVVDPTPTFTGTAGTEVGDLPTVTVRIRDADGDVVQTLTPAASGATWSATAAPLADGVYTVEVEQADVVGHVSTDTTDFTLTADVIDPEVSITSPAPGSATSDATPSITGTAGVQLGDDPTVTVEIFSGPGATGAPLHTLSVPRNDTTGAFGTEPSQPLALGSYSLRVSQADSADNVGESEVAFSVVDGEAPSVTIESPASGSSTTDSTPQIAGRAGTAASDAGTVTIRIFGGTGTGGAALQTLNVPRDGASGAWSTQPAALADGVYTVRAEQGDSAGNVGMSTPSTFTVDTSGPAGSEAPTFVLAPAEERLADVLAGRLTAVAACASACRVSARLTVSARAARSLGLGRKSTALGSGSKRLTRAGTASVGIRLEKPARAALRRRGAATATLRTTVTAGTRKLVLSRAISLRRSAGLRRIVSRGLRLWAVCSERCALSGKLSVSAAVARRLGLRPRAGSARMDVAGGRANAPAGSPTRLTLKVHRGARDALRKARRVRTLLEAVAGTAPNQRRTATRAMTLRR